MLRLCMTWTVMDDTKVPVFSYKYANVIPNIIIGKNPTIFVWSTAKMTAVKIIAQNMPIYFLNALYMKPLKNNSSMNGPTIAAKMLEYTRNGAFFSFKNSSTTGCFSGIYFVTFMIKTIIAKTPKRMGTVAI